MDAARGAARRVEIGYRFGIEQGLLERIDRADIRLRRAFLDCQADRRARQRRGGAAYQLGDTNALVGAGLAQDRDVRPVVGGGPLLALARGWVLDPEPMARGFSETLGQLVQ